MSLLELAVSTAVAGAAVQPGHVALDCAVLNPLRAMKPVFVEWHEGTTPKAAISFSIVEEPQVVASRIVQMDDLAGTKDRAIRQFYVEGGQGPLVFRVVNEGDGQWGLDIAPADWSFASGPIAMGRCVRSATTSSQLIPMESRSALPKLESTLRGTITEDWNLPSVAKNCELIGDGNLLSAAKIVINEKGILNFVDAQRTTYNGDFNGGLTASEGSHSVKHKLVKARSKTDMMSLSLFYRQGRFWVDGHKEGKSTSNKWFRGVCIDKALPEGKQ